jgi:hypothetical protein
MTKAEQISKLYRVLMMVYDFHEHSSFRLLPFLMCNPGITFWKLAPLLLSGDWEMHLSGGPLRNSYYQSMTDN